MNTFMDKLKLELVDYAEKCNRKDAPDVIDILWHCYLEYAPIDDGLIKEKEDTLTPVFNELSVKSSDILNGLICDLCTVYQRSAFLEGLQLGFLLTEFQAEQKHPPVRPVDVLYSLSYLAALTSSAVS